MANEYFEFKDSVQDWTPASGQIETGDSSGWYVTGEDVMPELSYIAPFLDMNLGIENSFLACAFSVIIAPSKCA